MALSLATIEADLKTAVSEADGYVDLGDKIADNVASYASEIPGVGADVKEAVSVLDELTKVLDKAKAVLSAV